MDGDDVGLRQFNKIYMLRQFYINFTNNKINPRSRVKNIIRVTYIKQMKLEVNHKLSLLSQLSNDIIMSPL